MTPGTDGTFTPGEPEVFGRGTVEGFAFFLSSTMISASLALISLAFVYFIVMMCGSSLATIGWSIAVMI